jgi:hypothetical protein
VKSYARYLKLNLVCVVMNVVVKRITNNEKSGDKKKNKKLNL